MTDREINIELVRALVTVRDHLGIRKDFCPLGVALELEPTINAALKLAKAQNYADACFGY